VSLARLSPPCLVGVALKPGAPVEQQADVLAASTRVDPLAQSGERQRKPARLNATTGAVTHLARRQRGSG
jgi:hypothetical protein